jgi:hypothetical protein
MGDSSSEDVYRPRSVSPQRFKSRLKQGPVGELHSDEDGLLLV